jgi:hypothetical protein
VNLVQIKGSNSDWESLNNVWGAAWETGQVPTPPLDFRIQDDAGVEVSLSYVFLTLPSSTVNGIVSMLTAISCHTIVLLLSVLWRDHTPRTANLPTCSAPHFC